jgi:hypothetical protein
MRERRDAVRMRGPWRVAVCSALSVPLLLLLVVVVVVVVVVVGVLFVFVLVLASVIPGIRIR